MNYNEIISQLPYKKPFLFVDALTHMDANGAEGVYTFCKEASFYAGHFKDFTVTPGVILTECCAQIGVVSLGVFLMMQEQTDVKDLQIGLSSTEMQFYKPVFPDEKVRVVSEKLYFRFHKLKCRVKMYNASNEVVCTGVIAGMIKSHKNG